MVSGTQVAWLGLIEMNGLLAAYIYNIKKELSKYAAGLLLNIFIKFDFHKHTGIVLFTAMTI